MTVDEIERHCIRGPICMSREHFALLIKLAKRGEEAPSERAELLLRDAPPPSSYFIREDNYARLRTEASEQPPDGHEYQRWWNRRCEFLELNCRCGGADGNIE